jgi:hypothetical protein
MANPHPAPGPGRPIGSKTQIDVFFDAAKIMFEMGFNPVEEAVKRYLDPKSGNGTKDAMLSLLIKRVSPEIRAIEHTGPNGANFMPTIIKVMTTGQKDIDGE